MDVAGISVEHNEEGQNLDDYEVVQDDNQEAGPVASQALTEEDGLVDEDDEEGEDLLNEDMLR